MGNFPHSHTPAAFFQTQLAEQLIELPSTDLGFSGITLERLLKELTGL